MKWVRRIALTLAGLIVLVLLLAAGLLFTAPGARLVLNRVLPAGAEIGRVHGRLWGPLVLEDVHFSNPGVEARIARVRVDWHPTRLLHSALDITTFEVDTADVRLKETGASGSGGGQGGFGPPSVPLAVRLESVEGRALRVRTASGDTIEAALVRLAGGARQDTFDLDSLRLRNFDVRDHRFQLRAGGRIVSGASGARDTAGIDVEWSGRLASGRPVAGHGTVRGAGGALALQHRLTAPIEVDLNGTIRDPWMPDSLRWTATLDVPRVALRELDDSLAGEVELTAEARGGLHAVEAHVDGQGEYPDLGSAAFAATVAYAADTVTVDTLRLRRLDGGGMIRGAGRVDLSGSAPTVDATLAWRDLGWPLDTASVASPDGSMHLAGGLAEFRATADLALRRPDRSLGRWTVDARGSYADRKLEVPQLVARQDAGGRVALTANVDLGASGGSAGSAGSGGSSTAGSAAPGGGTGPSGEATVEWRDLVWPPAPGDTTRLASTGRVEVRGAMEDFTVRGDVSASGPALPVSRLQLDVRGDASREVVHARVQATGTREGSPAVELTGRGSYRPADALATVDTLDVRVPETDGRLSLRGRADLSGAWPRVDARARWSGLGWPLREPKYRSEQGRLTVATRDTVTRVTATARIGGATIPEGEWRLAGQGGPHHFVVDSLAGAVLGGSIRVAGDVWPDSGPAWDLRVAGDTLDPGAWRPDWDGRVAFRARTDGRLAGGGPADELASGPGRSGQSGGPGGPGGAEGLAYRITLDSLGGTLRQRSLDGGARVEGTAGQLRVDTLWVDVGESTFAASGSAGDSLDLSWRLAAASLYDFVPNAVGQLDARGRLGGTRQSPSVSLTAQGSGLTAAGWSAEGLTASADVADAGAQRSTVALTLEGVHGSLVALDSVSLTAEGTRSDHTVAVRARSPDDSLRVVLTGGEADGRWTGALDRLRLRSSLAGDWRLRDTARLAIGLDSGVVERVCWEGSGELCASASWGRDGARWDASGSGLPLAFVRPVLPQGIIARGRFALETRGRTGAGSVPTGTLRVTADSGEVDYTSDVGRVVTQPFDSLAVDVTSDSTGIDGAAGLALGTLGFVRATASLPGRGPIGDRSLDGRVRLHLEDDGTVSRYLPSITESHGTADVDVTLAGSVATPGVRGQVTMSDVGAVVTAAGIRLSDGQLDAHSQNGGDWQVRAGILSDSSRLAISGIARPPGPDSTWLVNVTLSADTFPAVQTHDLMVVVSPRLQLRASPDSILVEGQIAVPRARIAVQQVEGTVNPSSDVVVVGAGTESADSMVTPAAVRSDVQLVLGNNVKIDARGLTGRLNGRLTIEAEPGRPPVGNGELTIVDGEYRIYRQTFKIDQGRLLYASTPLTNPGLDLRITRTNQDVTVGMEVSGRADDPRVQLFSNQSLSDEEILAYLIIGRPLRQLSQSEGSQVQNMAQSVGLAGGNLLLARLGAAFGLETARIERTAPDQEGQRQTSLVLGRQILPRVQLTYAIGLKAAANVIRLRYMITDHWILQTENGEEIGADLLYTFGSGGLTPIP